MDTSYRLASPFKHYGILFMIYGVGLLTLFSHTLFHAGHQHTYSQPAAASAIASTASSCTQAPAHTYRLTFTNRGITPSQVTAHRCDELTLVNNTHGEVMAALGPHEHHIHYPGFAETPLTHGQSYSFRLTQTGTLPLHDHDNDGLRATITVKN